MNIDVDARLKALGLVLPVAPQPIAAYVPGVRSGAWLIVSGQLPTKDGKVLATGKVPSEVTLDVAAVAGRQCVLNALSILQAELNGDWSQFSRVVRIGVFVQSDDTFDQQHKVANGASELLGEIFGAAGRHARAAVGVNALPLNASVEIEFTFEIQNHL